MNAMLELFVDHAEYVVDDGRVIVRRGFDDLSDRFLVFVRSRDGESYKRLGRPLRSLRQAVEIAKNVKSHEEIDASARAVVEGREPMFPFEPSEDLRRLINKVAVRNTAKMIVGAIRDGGFANEGVEEALAGIAQTAAAEYTSNEIEADAVFDRVCRILRAEPENTPH